MMSNRRVLVVISIVFLLTALIPLVGIPLKGDAEASNSTMRSLFESLNQRIANESEFFFAITFARPLAPEDDTVWIIPKYRETALDEISRVIAEVDDDHICFDILAGAARYIECTPYSNIVSVRYLVD